MVSITEELSNYEPFLLIGISIAECLNSPFVSSLNGLAEVDLPPEEDIRETEERIYVFVQAGVEIHSDENQIVQAVFLHGPRDEGFSRYEGMLPGGIRFEDSAEEVRYRFGKPVQSNPLAKLGASQLPPSDLFIFETVNCRITVKYQSNLRGIVQLAIDTPPPLQLENSFSRFLQAIGFRKG